MVMNTFAELPNEIVSLILDHVCANGDGPAISQVNQHLHELTERALYTHLTIPSSHALKLLVRTLSVHPHLARHVRSLALYTSRVPFDVAHKLARLLGPYQDRLELLQVRFPASDLPLALDFLESLSPQHFEWITSPTWMIRPGNLFQRFLTKWTRLRTLRLGNFYLDSVLAQSIASLPHITRLTLLGQSNKNLEPDALRTLLEGTPLLRLLEVGDCPLRRRVIVEAELGIARAGCGVAGAGALEGLVTAGLGGEHQQQQHQYGLAGFIQHQHPLPVLAAPPSRLILPLEVPDHDAPNVSSPPSTALPFGNNILGPTAAPPQWLLRPSSSSPTASPTEALLLPAKGTDVDSILFGHKAHMLAADLTASSHYYNYGQQQDPYAWHRRRSEVLRWVS
ncbi:hypothetical protein V8E36_002313 [Tilletia maclaganii]